MIPKVKCKRDIRNMMPEINMMMDKIGIGSKGIK